MSLPLVPSATNWTQHRVFVLDSNAQHIYAATEWAAGAPTAKTALDLGLTGVGPSDASRGVLFPVRR